MVSTLYMTDCLSQDSYEVDSKLDEKYGWDTILNNRGEVSTLFPLGLSKLSGRFETLVMVLC